MREKTARALFFFSLLWLLIPPAWGCTCLYSPPEESYRAADLIFVGTVKKFEKFFKTRERRRAWFDVESVWKGPKNGVYRVFTSSDQAMCGFDFVTGHTYLVYAYRVNNQWETTICTRTQDITEKGEDGAKEDFEVLKYKKLYEEEEGFGRYPR